MKLAMIAAVGRYFELGKDNDLVWHFKEDMSFFRETTRGATVIMGRKTFESLPKALQGRRNIVITRNADFKAKDVECVAGVEEAIEKAKEDDKVFIIGGAAIYKAFLKFAETLYLTEIDAEYPEADTFFPAFDKELYNKTVIKTIIVDGTRLEFCQYDKIN